jgi:oxygen-independent coproporphyrinogen-3 oxidase
MLDAIRQEICMRYDYLVGEALETIYIGGGTPSILPTLQLKSLFNTIDENFEVMPGAEITLETNPEDMSPGYLAGLKVLGINRLSVGIQSFHDKDLQFMNRRHSSKESRLCLESARNAGFRNINLDLIYGLPGLSLRKWKENLEMAAAFMPAHISAYHLTYEPGSVLDYRRLKHRFETLDEQVSRDQYNLLVNKLKGEGYQHYEISNFALPGYISKHNSAYWSGEKYLGVGPSAHSYNGLVRRWNVSRNTSYIKLIREGSVFFEEEELDAASSYHDYLMTSLRTMWGVDLERIRKEWGNQYAEHCSRQAGPFVQSGRMIKEGEKLILSSEGMFIADHIISELFL